MQSKCVFTFFIHPLLDENESKITGENWTQRQLKVGELRKLNNWEMTFSSIPVSEMIQLLVSSCLLGIEGK